MTVNPHGSVPISPGPHPGRNTVNRAANARIALVPAADPGLTRAGRHVANR